ncbi:MAG: hypothetical protein WA974_00035, partial [Thermodesulfobacteriota bacterium]
MTRWFLLPCLILALVIIMADHPQSANQGCLSCHRGIESPGPNHRFPCERCHGGNVQEESREKAHQGLIANPSSLDQAPNRCV